MRLSTSALCVGYRLRTTNQTAGICIGCERLGPVGMLPAAYRRADGSLDCPNRICVGRELTPADEAAAMADEVTHGEQCASADGAGVSLGFGSGFANGAHSAGVIR